MQGILQRQEQNNDENAQRRRFLCPSCGKHTVLWLLPTTEIKDLPVKCKLCSKESVVNITPISEL